MKAAITELMQNAVTSEQNGVPVDWKSMASNIANYAVNVAVDMEATMAKDKLWMDAAKELLTEEQVANISDKVEDTNQDS